MANFEVSEMHMVVGPCFRNVTFRQWMFLYSLIRTNEKLKFNLLVSIFRFCWGGTAWE